MHTPSRLVTTVAALLTGGALVIAGSLCAAPASAASTGSGISNITPYGGYLGNYIAPDGSRAYCIDPARDWPSGATGPGAVTSSITTDYGEPLGADTLQKLNFALTRYGQTADPVLAAAVNAYLYAYTSGYAHGHGAGFDAGLYYIDGNSAVQATYSQIWADVESVYASAPAPTAALSIEMTDPLVGTVTVTTSPDGAPGTLVLEGAVVADSDTTVVDVSGGEVVAIEGVPEEGATAYSIGASATFLTDSGPGPLVTLFETGSEQRIIRAATAPPVDFASSASLDVELPVSPLPSPPSTPSTQPPTALAATGINSAGMLGAGSALLALGLLSIVVRRPRTPRISGIQP